MASSRSAAGIEAWWRTRCAATTVPSRSLTIARSQDEPTPTPAT
ncbi:hypothetical protein WBK31_38900 [Nonomuraea sp. N2-4H]